jgi:hypothetical protein
MRRGGERINSQPKTVVSHMIGMGELTRKGGSSEAGEPTEFPAHRLGADWTERQRKFCCYPQAKCGQWRCGRRHASLRYRNLGHQRPFPCRELPSATPRGDPPGPKKAGSWAVRRGRVSSSKPASRRTLAPSARLSSSAFEVKLNIPLYQRYECQ